MPARTATASTRHGGGSAKGSHRRSIATRLHQRNCLHHNLPKHNLVHQRSTYCTVQLSDNLKGCVELSLGPGASRPPVVDMPFGLPPAMAVVCSGESHVRTIHRSSSPGSCLRPR